MVAGATAKQRDIQIYFMGILEIKNANSCF